jgi:dihydrodipicolinate reductase
MTEKNLAKFTAASTVTGLAGVGLATVGAIAASGALIGVAASVAALSAAASVWGMRHVRIIEEAHRHKLDSKAEQPATMGHS